MKETFFTEELVWITLVWITKGFSSKV